MPSRILRLRRRRIRLEREKSPMRPRTKILLVMLLGLAVLGVSIFAFPLRFGFQAPNFEAGQIAEEEIIAPFAFDVPKPNEEVDLERARAAQVVLPVFVMTRPGRTSEGVIARLERGIGKRARMAAIVDTAVRRIFTEDWLAAHPEAVAERREVLLRIDPVRFAAACRALAMLDLRPQLSRIQNPTLVVVGARDAATPPALARELASGIRGAKLVELPDCGHCPPLQQPEEFVAAIAPFLGIAA